MARKIHYDRAKIDLDLAVSLPAESVRQLIAAAIPDKYVKIAGESSGGMSAEVVSWAHVGIGRFEVRWTGTDGGVRVSSSLVQSVLTSTSWLPFVFGKGKPQALGSYQNAMARVREALRPAGSSQ